MEHCVLLSSDSLDTELVVFLSSGYVVEVWEQEGRYYYKLCSIKTIQSHEEKENVLCNKGPAPS